jgi:hypothetical protein
MVANTIRSTKYYHSNAPALVAVGERGKFLISLVGSEEWSKSSQIPDSRLETPDSGDSELQSSMSLCARIGNCMTWVAR